MYTVDSLCSTVEDRVLAVVAEIHESPTRDQARRLSAVALAQPNALRRELADTLGLSADRVVVTGTVEHRMLFVQMSDGDWIVADLSGSPLAARKWPNWTTDRMQLARPDGWVH